MKNCILCSECICSVLKGRKERHVNVLHPKLIIISSLPNESSLQAVQRQIDLPLHNVACPQLFVKKKQIYEKFKCTFFSVYFYKCKKASIKKLSERRKKHLENGMHTVIKIGMDYGHPMKA